MIHTSSFASCSDESSVENGENGFEVVGFPPDTEVPLKEVKNAVPLTKEVLGFLSFRSGPLTRDQFQNLFDREGRLTNEHFLRQLVFRGGVEESIRPEVWCFLFGIYPCLSTEKERSVLREQKVSQYYALKRRWQAKLLDEHPNFDFSTPDNFLMDNVPVHKTDKSKTEPSTTVVALQRPCNLEDHVCKLEAEIFASRIDCSLKPLVESLRFISKDVPRTDRNHPYFEDSDAHLLALRDALMTACLLCPEMGYVQGMNDIMARFLIVFDSEPFAFWCFHYYIETVQKDFLSDGMLQRIQMLKNLLREMDSDLYEYLHVCGVADMIFCHKWLLLGFQREFSFSDGLRLLEILSSHHLELYAPQGMHAREESRRILQQKGMNLASEFVAADFSFDLFVAAAILVLFRDRVFQCSDGTQVFQFISNLSGQLPLDDVLSQAERLFYAYCHKSVMDAFLLL